MKDFISEIPYFNIFVEMNLILKNYLFMNESHSFVVVVFFFFFAWVNPILKLLNRNILPITHLKFVQLLLKKEEEEEDEERKKNQCASVVNKPCYSKLLFWKMLIVCAADCFSTFFFLCTQFIIVVLVNM